MTGRQQIVVDWGTSNFRAFLFADDGTIAEEHEAAAGILHVSGGAFEAALEREIGHWIDAECDIFLSGMITSRNGWVETAYVDTPADLMALATNATKIVSARGARLLFLPGVAARHPLPDVMRGEEIQVFGSISQAESATIVLPGTHSKWVRVVDGRIVDFRTFLTGEVYSLLKTQSIVGRLIPPQPAPHNAAVFIEGVRQATSEASSGLLHDVFTARSGALLGNFPPQHIADRLSGLIIGHELRAGIALGWAHGPLRLVGAPDLCRRYHEALQSLGQDTAFGPDHAAVAGFKRLIALGDIPS